MVLGSDIPKLSGGKTSTWKLWETPMSATYMIPRSSFGCHQKKWHHTFFNVHIRIPSQMTPKCMFWVDKFVPFPVIHGDMLASRSSKLQFSSPKDLQKFREKNSGWAPRLVRRNCSKTTIPYSCDDPVSEERQELQRSSLIEYVAGWFFQILNTLHTKT